MQDNLIVSFLVYQPHFLYIPLLNNSCLEQWILLNKRVRLSFIPWVVNKKYLLRVLDNLQLVLALRLIDKWCFTSKQNLFLFDQTSDFVRMVLQQRRSSVVVDLFDVFFSIYLIGHKEIPWRDLKMLLKIAKGATHNTCSYCVGFEHHLLI